MVKFFITIFAIVVIVYGYHKFSTRNEFVSFNEVGDKIVRAECNPNKSYECKLIVGKHCKSAGYEKISNELEDDELIFTVVCGKQEGFLDKVLNRF